MAIRGVDFKWYDGFFLSMLATSIIIVAINWNRYHLCLYPLHIWIVADYTTVFIFRLLMFVDNWLAAGMGLDFGWQQRKARFYGRVGVLSILALLIYPFLWAWTVIGTLWFSASKDCLPEEGQKVGLLIWLLFSYCGLLCIACISMGKWLARRQAHLLRVQQGIIPFSEYGCVAPWKLLLYTGTMVCQERYLGTSLTRGIFIFVIWIRETLFFNELASIVSPKMSQNVLLDMIRVPDWAFEAAGQEMRGMGQEAAAYQPGLYLTPAQREAVEALIQELPKFTMKAVPTDCSECPICLEEFHVGNEVRGLPCAHNFHVECIDEWLRLNVKCPRCRCSVFPNLDLSALSTIRADSERSTAIVATAAPYVRSQPPSSQSYRLRIQSFLRPVHAAGPVGGEPHDSSAAALEMAENGSMPAENVRVGPTQQ